MNDITLCKGQNCPLKEQCKRFKTKPEDLQSYFIYTPYDHRGEKCDYYLPTNNKPDVQSN